MLKQRRGKKDTNCRRERRESPNIVQEPPCQALLRLKSEQAAWQIASDISDIQHVFRLVQAQQTRFPQDTPVRPRGKDAMRRESPHMQEPVALAPHASASGVRSTLNLRIAAKMKRSRRFQRYNRSVPYNYGGRR